MLSLGVIQFHPGYLECRIPLTATLKLRTRQARSTTLSKDITNLDNSTNVCVLITAAIITAIYCHKKKQQQNSTEISTPLPPESLEDDPL